MAAAAGTTLHSPVAWGADAVDPRTHEIVSTTIGIDTHNHIDVPLAAAKCTLTPPFPLTRRAEQLRQTKDEQESANPEQWNDSSAASLPCARQQTKDRSEGK
jgi:hypothetical protein